MNYALFYLHYENLQKNDNLELINYSVFLFILFICFNLAVWGSATAKACVVEHAN